MGAALPSRRNGPVSFHHPAPDQIIEGEPFMLIRKIALLALTFSLAVLAVAPVSIVGGSLVSNAAFARGGDDGGCHPDDNGPCRGEPEPNDR
jgi:hypothetical protein